MRRALFVLVLLACSAPAALATADPGAVDRTFGGDGVVDVARTDEVDDVTALGDGRLAVRRFSGVRFLGASGAPQSPARNSAQTIVVLADGRYVTQRQLPRRVDAPEAETSPTVVSRRRNDGSLDPSFGAEGRIELRARSVVAVGPDGRLLVGRSVPTGRFTQASRFSLVRADGVADPGFEEFQLPTLNRDFLTFDTQGRLLVGESGGAVRRLTPEGADDTSFRPFPVMGDPFQVLPSPDGTRTFVGNPDYGQRRAAVLDERGVAIPVPSEVAELLLRSRALLFDGANRLVVVEQDVTAGTERLLRVSADLQRVRVLRAKLPGARAQRVDVLDGTLDARGRIVLAGSRLLGSGATPAECRFMVCRDDLAETQGVVIRLEGGDRRVAVLSRRLGPTVAVRCLAVARLRCSGSLALRRSGRPAARRRIELAPGTTRRFAVPRGLRRGARALTVEVRAVDASRELFTARRVLER